MVEVAVIIKLFSRSFFKKDNLNVVLWLTFPVVMVLFYYSKKFNKWWKDSGR
jgi:hypothetical protein